MDHGETVLVNGTLTDTTELEAMGMLVADMVPDDPGTWLFHCHVNVYLQRAWSRAFGRFRRVRYEACPMTGLHESNGPPYHLAKLLNLAEDAPVSTRRAIAALFAGGTVTLLSLTQVDAAGTVRIQQGSGAPQVFSDANVRIAHQALQVTAGDGKRVLIMAHANCAYAGILEHCEPYSVRILQNGSLQPVSLASGSGYVNPTNHPHPVPNSSAQLPGHGVTLSMRTKDGTTVSLDGTIDQLQR